MKNIKHSPVAGAKGFTLIELVTIVAVVAMLSVLGLTAMAGVKGQTKVSQCADNVRQFVMVSQIYANENQDTLPPLVGGASWLWDLPDPVAQTLLALGMQKKNFYCPGTEPKFTDELNWAGSDSVYGIASTLWNFGVTANPPRATDMHVIGYAPAFWGANSVLNSTNQNKTMQPEMINIAGTYVTVPNPQRVLVADATISQYANKPYANPANNYISIVGGFIQNGVYYTHLSPHLNGLVPVGGNLGFKDGHVGWRQFNSMVPRTSSGIVFWW